MPASETKWAQSWATLETERKSHKTTVKNIVLGRYKSWIPLVKRRIWIAAFRFVKDAVIGVTHRRQLDWILLHKVETRLLQTLPGMFLSITGGAQHKVKLWEKFVRRDLDLVNYHYLLEPTLFRQATTNSMFFAKRNANIFTVQTHLPSELHLAANGTCWKTLKYMYGQKQCRSRSRSQEKIGQKFIFAYMLVEM